MARRGPEQPAPDALRSRVSRSVAGLRFGPGLPRVASWVAAALCLVFVVHASQGAVPAGGTDPSLRPMASTPPEMAAAPARSTPTPAPTLAPSPTPVPTSILAHPEPSRRAAVIQPKPGSEYYHGDANQSDIYITIDDCQNWSRVDTDLETARAKGVTLTLFPAGKYIDTAEAEAEKELQKAVSYGDEIDNHTYSHTNLAGLPTSVDGLKADLDRQIEVVRTALKDPTYREWFVRTPYGSGMDNPNLINAAAKDGLAIVKWTLDSSGYVTNSTVGYALKNVFEDRNFKGGAIILLHDDYTDMKALPLIIDTIRAKGFTVGGPLRNILIDPAAAAFRGSRDKATATSDPEVVAAREDYAPAA